jgi:hypothetical protein
MRYPKFMRIDEITFRRHERHETGRQLDRLPPLRRPSNETV